MSEGAKLVALLGSTASGKSEIALRLCEKDPENTVILSCDSLLVYRELEIGTAKPSTDELKKYAHHGINLVSPRETYTAGDYVRYAKPLLDQWVSERKKVLIVGGTGFYLKSLLFGVWDAPAMQPTLRAELEMQSSEVLHEKLRQRDPQQAEKIKANDRYRVIRALEIIETTGKKISELNQTQALQNPLPYPVALFGITRTPLELERRIRARTNQMFEAGIVEETKALAARYPDLPRSLQCVGYKEVLEFLSGKLTLPECRERVVISTRQLAKKQRTFFKTLSPKIQWYSLPLHQEDLFAAIENCWRDTHD